MIIPLELKTLDRQVLFTTLHLSLQLITLLPPAFQLGSNRRKKQADACVEPSPNPSGNPSVVLEVGSSESLTQLKIDARLWIEHMNEVS